MVNVDTVYQRVLALANKEQRGYITPQEFNLFANQAQMDIFEQYFYDLNQFRRVPGNDSKYADMVDTLEEKISIFKSGPMNRSNGQVVHFTWYKLTDLNYNGKIVTEIRHEDYQKMQTPLLKPNANRPVYWKTNGKIYFEGVPSGEIVSCNYIKKPTSVNWTYVVVGEKALVNPNSSAGYQDFELHQSEETNLVIKILGLAGITLKDALLYQAAAAEDNKSIQQEKQ